MSPEVRESLEDILSSANTIQEFVKEHSFESYCCDIKTRLAIERSFEIIGEAMNRLKRYDEEILVSIRNYRSIISFRNILAHGYDHIEDRIVWGIIQSDLEPLIEDIKSLL